MATDTRFQEFNYDIIKINSFREGNKMATDTRFQVRDTQEELEKLDKAIRKLGYKDRADWYRDCKRQVIRQAESSKYAEYRRQFASGNAQTRSQVRRRES